MAGRLSVILAAAIPLPDAANRRRARDLGMERGITRVLAVTAERRSNVGLAGLKSIKSIFIAPFSYEF
jgi:hypothetical protein